MPELKLRRTENMLEVILDEHKASIPLTGIVPEENVEQRISAVDYGRVLFEKIFQNEHLQRALSNLQSNERLVLVLDDPLLATIPWERLRDPDGRVLASYLSVVRRVPVPSPYIFSTPVKDQALVGREDLFLRIATLWSAPEQHTPILIYGQRRMGKTSVAQALASRSNFGDVTLFVYPNMIGINREGDLYYEIAERLWLFAKDKMVEPDRTRFTPKHARISFNNFLTHFHKVNEKSGVILVMDEFESLHRYLGLEVTYQAIANLHSQTQTFHWLALALVGQNDLEDLSHIYGKPLLGWEPIHVSFLDAKEVANVLANPAGDPDFPLDYTAEALTMIATLTNGQPYLVQVIGHLLVQYYNLIVFSQQKEHSGVFGTTDVQAVIDDDKFFAIASTYFKGAWVQATSRQPGEAVLLKALAKYEDGMDENALRTATDLDETNFLQSLTSLERHDILCRKDNRIHYSVPLMRRWVLVSNP